jgi:serine/threonine protein kinase
VKEDTSFGARPEQLRRLYAMGLDESDEPERVESVTSWGLLKEEPGSRIGRYRLLSVLGEGGMGVVYLAEQEHPIKRQVALKIIKPGMDSARIVSRFEAERQTLALLDHPNIAHVLDGGTTPNGRPYFVMERVEGLPITEYCDRYQLNVPDRLNLFLQICHAVQHAHQKGFIHRDLKPSNIMVTVQDDEPMPKVIDFGVARALSQPLTQETLLTWQGQLIGTPEYMSPEQLNLGSEETDVRSDVYSLGVLLYLLLTGVMPFDTETLRQKGLENLSRVLREEEPRTPTARLSDLGEKATEIASNRGTDVRTLAHWLHKELGWIPLKAMRKQRAERYQSVAELAQDIGNYLNNLPLIAGPPSTAYRLKKFVKRNRTLVAVVAIAVLAMVAGSFVSLRMYVRAEVQAQRSQAISSFLDKTVLRALDPYRREGGEITPVSVLDAVAAGLEGKFQDAPLTEAEIRNRLGRTYETNAQWDTAILHLQKALDIRRRELGNHHPLTVQTMHRLGWALYGARRAHEAETTFVEALAESVRQFGEDYPRTISIKRMLAWTYMWLGDYDRAMQLGQETLTAARRVLGPNAEITVYAAFGIGLLHLYMDHLDEAEKWYTEALRMSRLGLGEDHAVTHDTAGWLGWIYALQGRYDDGAQVLGAATADEARIFGDSHRRTIENLQQLLRLYVAWNRPEQAAQCWEQLQAATPDAVTTSAGSFRYDAANNTYTILDSTRSGLGTGHVFDQFQFVHKTLNGDGSITARIDGISHVDCITEVGLMIRNSLTPTAQHASIFLVPTGTVFFRHRADERGREKSTPSHIKGLTFPYWLRLERRGTTFTVQHSSNGQQWQDLLARDPDGPVSVEITMNETVHVGLAVMSWSPGRTTEARVSNVTVTGQVEPAGPFLWSKNIGFQMIAFPEE